MLMQAMCPMAAGLVIDCMAMGCTRCPGAGSKSPQRNVRCWLRFLEARQDLETCMVCGCTDDAPCSEDADGTSIGACWWAQPNLCSACVGLAEELVVSGELKVSPAAGDETDGTHRTYVARCAVPVTAERARGEIAEN
jgi:hypothetical protein